MRNNNYYNNKIWICGKHTVLAALSNKNRKIYKLLVTKDTYSQVENAIKEYKCLYKLVTNKELDNLFKGTTHQGFALQTNSIFHYNLKDISSKIIKQQSIVVVLDQLTDIQNIGNILRSAYAFNVDAIITPKDHSFSETSTLSKIACGAMESVPIVFVTNLVSTLKLLKDKGYWIIGLDCKAKEYLHKFQFTSKTVIVVGAEGSGLRELTQKNCDFLLKIAMNKSAESINVSNACAIAMYSYFNSIF